MRTLLSLALGAVALVGTTRPVVAPRAGPHCARVVVHQRGPLPAACVRLEGDQIGALPTSFVAGGQPVVIDEWAARDATGKELVGFAADLPGDVVYVVHAGDQTFVDMRARWLHPAGVVGPRSQAIDALTFCHVPARVDGCPAPLELD